MNENWQFWYTFRTWFNTNPCVSSCTFFVRSCVWHDVLKYVQVQKKKKEKKKKELKRTYTHEHTNDHVDDDERLILAVAQAGCSRLAGVGIIASETVLHNSVANHERHCTGVSRMQVLRLRFIEPQYAWAHGGTHDKKDDWPLCCLSIKAVTPCLFAESIRRSLCLLARPFVWNCSAGTASRNTGVRSISEGWLVAAFHPSCDPPIPLGDYPSAGSTLLMVSFSAIPKWRSLEISNYGLLRNFLENRYCSVYGRAPLLPLRAYPRLGGFRREIRLIFNAALYDGAMPRWGNDRYALCVRDEFRRGGFSAISCSLGYVRPSWCVRL